MNFVVGLIVAIGLLVAGVLFLIATDPGLLDAGMADVISDGANAYVSGITIQNLAS